MSLTADILWSLSPSVASAIEWSSVVTNLLFIILLIRRNIWCWIFGIIGSLLAVLLWASYEVRLYSEAVLYLIYAVLGFYGWWKWKLDSEKEEAPISSWGFSLPHVSSFLCGVLMFLGLGYFMSIYTEASMPWIDAFTSSFSLVATFLEAKRVLQGWLYWIVLNSVSIYVYNVKGAKIMAGLMVVYAILSVVGLVRWGRDYYLAKR